MVSIATTSSEDFAIRADRNAGSVIAATHDGIFRTLDDGITWHHVGVQHDIKVLEAEPGRAIAIGEGGSVWSSAGG